MDVDRWGVQQEWTDADEQPQRVADDVVAAVRELVGEPPTDLEERAPLVTRRGRSLRALGVDGPVEVVCEDGEVRTVDDVVPDDLPLGYHRLRTADGDAAGERLLVVSPGRCWLPPGRTWGLTAQLYAARSRESWGIGDLADLRALRTWTAAHGGGFVLVNPLHAVAPLLPQETSPYLPATRRFRNPLYLHVGDVPGWDAVDLGDDAAELAAVMAAGLVERDRALGLKLRCLRRTFDRTRAALHPEFLVWRDEQGPGLQLFATWSVLSAEHGADWRTWPEPLRHSDGVAVAEQAELHDDDVSFHAWLQWLLDRQLRDAAGELMVLQDLPIGVSGAGVDSWVHQDVLATGASVGAPPDALNGLGQDWGSPPLVPWRLRLADYAPFVEAVRGTMAAGGGLRIDHVMGLFRLWWVPVGSGPTDGAYVHYPSDDLLDIVALESHRSQAVVVGEDLGTVEDQVREDLAARDVLGYRVLWFEDDDPAEWPELSMAAVTTHDLATVAGLWTGSDVDDQAQATGQDPEQLRAGNAELLARLRRDGLAEDADVDAALTAAHAQLGRAGSLLRSVALEDVVAAERRPNVPGTGPDERENWRIPLPVPVDELVAGDPPAWLTGL